MPTITALQLHVLTHVYSHLHLIHVYFSVHLFGPPNYRTHSHALPTSSTSPTCRSLPTCVSPTTHIYPAQQLGPFQHTYPIHQTCLVHCACPRPLHCHLSGHGHGHILVDRFCSRPTSGPRSSRCVASPDNVQLLSVTGIRTKESTSGVMSERHPHPQFSHTGLAVQGHTSHSVAPQSPESPERPGLGQERTDQT